ncbi:MAG: hydrolase [Candidatus Micrarchaeota archaeon]
MEPECICPDIDLKAWDGKTLSWKSKPFYAVKIPALFHIPLGFEGAVKKAEAAIEKDYKKAEPFLMLVRDEGLFSAKILFALDESVHSGPGVETLSGILLTKAFSGKDYSEAGKWAKEALEYAKSKTGVEPRELFFWYANCPKCAKKQGGVKTVVFAKVD